MSVGNLVSIRTIVQEGLPKCLCSAVQDERTGTIHDPGKMGDAIIRHAEIMQEENDRLYRDAVRIVFEDIKEQARMMRFVADWHGGDVLEHERSDATYGSVIEWIEALENRMMP